MNQDNIFLILPKSTHLQADGHGVGPPGGRLRSGAVHRAARRGQRPPVQDLKAYRQALPPHVARRPHAVACEHALHAETGQPAVPPVYLRNGKDPFLSPCPSTLWRPDTGGHPLHARKASLLLRACACACTAPGGKGWYPVPLFLYQSFILMFGILEPSVILMFGILEP